MADDGFRIENLNKFERQMLEFVRKRFPAVVQRILHNLGEVLLGEAKAAFKADTRPHARFAKKTRTVSRGMNKGRKRNYLAFTGTQNTNAIDKGLLWNSLSRGASGNVWTFDGKSGAFRLTVGSSVPYARYINDGYKMGTPHWVPGIVDSRGIFRYQRGADTGLFVKAYEYKGVQFFEIGMKELEKLAPKIIRSELTQFVEEFNNAQ